MADIYLDYNASTPIDPSVADVMQQSKSRNDRRAEMEAHNGLDRTHTEPLQTQEQQHV